MLENNNDYFSFDVDSTNELTEEIFAFSENDYKRNNLVFFVGLIAASVVIMFVSYQIGARLNIDKEELPRIFENLTQTDASYIEESATKDTLLAEKESLTQELLKQQSESGQLRAYSINKSTLESKLAASKKEFEELTKAIENKKNKLSTGGTEVYSLTLTPGVYIVGSNIPAATYSVTGNGSILASSKEKETKINEKLSGDTPLEIQLFDEYTIKINAITKFVLKE